MENHTEISTSSGIAERLRELRLHLGYTQKQMAAAAKAKYRSWQDYECGKNVPGGRVLAGLAEIGINVNWVLTGEGDMRIAPTEMPSGDAALQSIQEQLDRLSEEQLRALADDAEARLERLSREVTNT